MTDNEYRAELDAQLRREYSSGAVVGFVIVAFVAAVFSSILGLTCKWAFGW